MKNPRKRVKLSSDEDESWSSQAGRKKKRPVKKQQNRARKTEEPDSGNSEVENDPTPLPVNTSGLPTFPDELLLEVLSHYPAIPLPTAKSESFDPEAHRERREALLALSQTCSNLRRFFHPYIWQRIEVVSGMWFPSGGYRPTERLFNLELLRQLEIVTIRDPSLAEYVKVVNVEVTKYSGNAVLAELARCMALFPNLHTVKLQPLVNSNSKPVWMLDSGVFSRYSYPTVRSVIVSRRVFHLVRFCPAVQWVHSINASHCCNNLVTLMLHSCRFLKNLELELPIKDGFKVIVEAFPRVCTLKIRFTPSYFFEHKSHFSLLSKFEHLKSLSIAVRSAIPKTVKEAILTWAKNFLLDLQQKDKQKRRIHMEYTRDGHRNTEVKKVNVTLHPPEPICADDQL